MSDLTYHVPVMVKEVIEGLDIQPGRQYIDATLGGGGHAWEIVKRGGDLLGLDLDQEALEFAREKLEVGSKKLEKIGKWKFVKGNFRDIEKIARENGFDRVDGILFDLGVASHQLDTGERGFSYRFRENALDLRFDQKRGVPASELINHLSGEELYEIFAKFGEEKRARAIAYAVVRARHLEPIYKAGDLADLVGREVAEKDLPGTLSRIFQALRIVINNETGNLTKGLAGAQKLLVSGGRIVVISFQSLEDRAVKRFLREGSFKILTKKPLTPTKSELKTNIRARSAKLRIAEKL